MKKLILLFCSLILFPYLYAQETIGLQDLKETLIKNGVYSAPKNYKYQVTKLDAQGDTLSTEIVNMHIPEAINTKEFENGKVYFIWEHTAWRDYEATLSPISKAVVQHEWLSADTTTMHLDDELYLHPLRENQYYQAEVAAHPTVKFGEFVDGKYQSRIIIMKGFGEYNMQEFKSIFQVKVKANYLLNKKELDCYKIVAETQVKAFSFGSVKGKKSEIFPEAEVINTTTFLISKEYGFVKISYQFYDGEQLFLEMVE